MTDGLLVLPCMRGHSTSQKALNPRRVDMPSQYPVEGCIFLTKGMGGSGQCVSSSPTYCVAPRKETGCVVRVLLYCIRTEHLLTGDGGENPLETALPYTRKEKTRFAFYETARVESL